MGGLEFRRSKWKAFFFREDLDDCFEVVDSFLETLKASRDRLLFRKDFIKFYRELVIACEDFVPKSFGFFFNNFFYSWKNYLVGIFYKVILGNKLFKLFIKMFSGQFAHIFSLALFNRMSNFSTPKFESTTECTIVKSVVDVDLGVLDKKLRRMLCML